MFAVYILNIFYISYRKSS